MEKSQVITVEKGIPLLNPTRLCKTSYPFEVMEKGDSFIAGAYDRNLLHKVSAQNNYSHKLNRKFACRKTPEGYLRVWRVE